MKYTLFRWGALALMIGSLAACGGGGGGSVSSTTGGGGTTTPTTPTSSSAVAASITAAAATPANATGTTPTAAFAVVQAAGVAPVIIHSPPEVNFTVISDGAVVQGLTTSNARFIIAKLVPGTNGSPDQWVSYTNKTVTALTTVGPGGKPVDATAIQPTTDSGGTLVYNDAGYYTYTFGADIKANDGSALQPTFDPNATSRVVIQLSYTNAAGQTVLVNPYFDFTIDANGNSVAVTDTSKDHKVVDISSCNQCHEKLALHGGGRVDTQYCVMCHNAGNTDPYSGNVLDFRVMIHKIHSGADIQMAAFGKDYSIWGYPPTAPTQHDYQDVGFPQDLRNCTKCHDNTTKDANGNLLNPQGDNWETLPNRAACGACHSGIDFSTGKGVTIADGLLGKTSTTTYGGYAHGGGPQPDDSQCATCHGPNGFAPVAAAHRTTTPSPHNPVVQAGVHTFAYNISGVTIDSSNFVHVDFQILEDGSPVALNAGPGATELITGFSGSPGIIIAYATGQDGIAAPSDWNSGHDSMSLLDATNGVNGNSLAVKDATTNTYTAVVKSSSAGGHSTAHSLALPADAKMVTALLASSFTQDGMYTDSTNTTPLPVPGIPAMMAATGNTPDGTPNVARRVVFNESACDTCHDRLGTMPNFHGGNYSIAMCAACHTPDRADRSGWAASIKVWVHAIHGASQRTVPFTATGSATDNFSMIGYPGVLKNCTTCHEAGTFDFSASQFTASGSTVLSNMLYVTAAYGSPAAAVTAPQAAPVGSGNYAYGSSYGCGSGIQNPTSSCSLVVGSSTSNLFGDSAPSIDNATGLIAVDATTANNLVSSPIAAACTACHDDATTLSHVISTGYGSFYAPRSTAITVKEQCLFCHGPSGIEPIAAAHNPTSAPW